MVDSAVSARVPVHQEGDGHSRALSRAKRFTLSSRGQNPRKSPEKASDDGQCVPDAIHVLKSPWLAFLFVFLSAADT